MEVIILEDEHLAAKRLKRMLTDLDKKIEVLHMFETIQDTAEYLLNVAKQPDILFIDIHVADGNSFELFNILDVYPKVIFTTAYDEYAVQAFRKNAIDYLLKPLKIEELKQALSKVQLNVKPQAMHGLEQEYKSRFLIRFGTKLRSLKTQNISYIYSENKLSYFVDSQGHRIPSDYKLQDLETMLDPKYFFRINRQFIIHIDAVDQMMAHTKTRIKIGLKPAYKDSIVISTTKTPHFKKWLDR